MNASDLQHIAGGFQHEAWGSQAVFRAAMNALSYPGRWTAMPTPAERPSRGHGAAAVLLLALLDADIRLWLSPSLAACDAAPWLRFHTGCRLVDEVREAQMLWVGAGDAMPALAQLAAGTDHQPEFSATCILEVEQGCAGHGQTWTLSGPGVAGSMALSVSGLAPDFAEQWARNHAGFPRGVDAFLCTPTQVVGLPRSTRLLRTDTRSTEEA